AVPVDPSRASCAGVTKEIALMNPSAPARRTLSLPTKSDAGRHERPAGVVVPERGKRGKRGGRNKGAQDRSAQLDAQRRLAEARARFAEAQRDAMLQALGENPEIRKAVLVAAQVAALELLAREDEAVARLIDAEIALSPEAAATLLGDLDAGPRTV